MSGQFDYTDYVGMLTGFKKLGFQSENKIKILSEECERLNNLVQKKNNEIRNLGGQIQEHQENLRLSTLQANKLRQ